MPVPRSRNGRGRRPLTCPDRNISIHPPAEGLTEDQKQPSSYQAKLRDSVQENIEGFIDQHGHGHCYSLLITARPMTPQQFGKCINSAKTNLLRDLFLDQLDVVEANRRGSPHTHGLVALSFESPNFPHDTLRRCRKAWNEGRQEHSKALWKAFLKMLSPELRDLWQRLQAALPKYGLGKMIELVPLREPKRSVACYYGKYLTKGFKERSTAVEFAGNKSWKHVRLVRYPAAKARAPGEEKLPPKWKKSSAQRSSAGPGGWLWRARLAKVAGVLGVDEQQGFKRLLGRRWFWHHKDTINRVEITDYPSPAHAARDGLSLPEEVGPGPLSVTRGKATFWDGLQVITLERGGFLTPMEAAIEALRKASDFVPAARSFLERLFRSVRPAGYIAPPMMDCPF